MTHPSRPRETSADDYPPPALLDRTVTAVNAAARALRPGRAIAVYDDFSWKEIDEPAAE